MTVSVKSHVPVTESSSAGTKLPEFDGSDLSMQNFVSEEEPPAVEVDRETD